MALTNQQKLNIAWADWIAGASTSPLGILSFAIAGGASWLYYQEHYPLVAPPVINPDPDPSPENDGDRIGYDHNLLCRAFADEEYTTITFADVISVASQIRPDLAEQLENMLSELEVTNRDYNAVNALNEGTLSRWLGFEWVPVSVDVLPTGTSGGQPTRQCVAYVKECMARGEWANRMTIVQQIPLWFNDWLVLIQEYFNGARLLDNGIVQIECLEPLTTEWSAAQ